MQSPRGSPFLSAPSLATQAGDTAAASPGPASALKMQHAGRPASPKSPRGRGQKVPASSPVAGAPALGAQQHEPCQRCGATSTPTWRPAALGGPKVLCNACGLKKHTLRAIHGTPDGKPVRSPAGTPCQQLPPMPMAALPPATPDCKRSRAAIAAAGPAEARTPTRRSQAAANDAPPWTEGPSGEATPELSPRPAEATARQQLRSPPRLFKSPRAPDRACSPANTRSGMTPLKSPEAGGFHTPTNRMRPSNRGPISPATSHDARQLMFLSAPMPRRDPESKFNTAPKSASGSKAPGSSISERNRAAAMARWHVLTPAPAPASCRKCSRDVKGVVASTGQQLCGSKKRKSLDGEDETLASPVTRAAGRAAVADGDADFVPDGATAAAPRPGKKSRRTAAAKKTSDGGSGKKPGRPPKWPERGESAARDAAAAMLPGDFTRVEQILVEAPGRAPFKLARLGGAPHGQPALALRQVQVALVPHTDRTSAFYLAMIRAAEAVSGLVRSASRPEMALLVSGGALAKGACRASIGTFPAVAKGLARLGVDDATIAALNAHDVCAADLRTPLPPPRAGPATPAAPNAEGAVPRTGAVADASAVAGAAAAAPADTYTLGSIAEETPAASPPGTFRRGARTARGGDAAGCSAAEAVTEPAVAAQKTAAAAMQTPAPASATTSVSHRRRRRKPCKGATPAAVLVRMRPLAPMFASPEPRANTSNCSADTVLQVDPAWSLPPAGGDAPRPSRQTNKPQRFSPEPGITSDDGCSGRGKRRHMSTSSSAGGQQEAGRQEAALRELGIHAAWLPLLQAAPTGAMHIAAAGPAQRSQQSDGDRFGASPREGAAAGRKGGQHVTFEEPTPTDSGASDDGHLHTVNISCTAFGNMVKCFGGAQMGCV